jgi:hypothetical protein
MLWVVRIMVCPFAFSLRISSFTTLRSTGRAEVVRPEQNDGVEKQGLMKLTGFQAFEKSATFCRRRATAPARLSSRCPVARIQRGEKPEFTRAVSYSYSWGTRIDAIRS